LPVALNRAALAARLLIILILMAVPLAFTPLLRDRFTQIKFAILQLCIPFIVGLVVVLCAGKVRLLLTGPLVLPSVLLVAAAFLSVSFACNGWWAARSAAGLGYLVAIMLACQATVVDRISLKKVLVAVLIAGTVVAFLGLLQYWEVWIFKRLPDTYGELQTPTTLGHNNFAAAYLIAVAPIAIAFLSTARSVPVMVSAGVSAGIVLYFLVLTGSRGGWIGLLAGAAVWCAWWAVERRRGAPAAGARRRASRPAVVAGVVVVGVIAAIVLSPGARRLVKEKAGCIVDLSDKPIKFRLLTWRSTLAMIADHPFGIGISNFEFRYPEYRSVQEHRITGRYRKVRRVHNEYLQAAAELGPLGLIAFFFLIAALLKTGFEVARRTGDEPTKRLCQAILVGQIGILVHSLFSFPLQLPTSSMMFWAMAGLISGQARRLAVQRQASRPWPIVWRRRLAVAVLVAVAFTIVQLSGSQYIAQYHRSRGLAFKNRGLYREAVGEFARAEQFCGSDFLTHYLASVCLRKLGLIQEAIEQSQQSLACNPNDRHTIFNLGTLYSFQGRTSEALRLWRRVLSLDPDYADAYFNMGVVLAGQGKLGVAATAYENALRIDPGMSQACHNLVVILKSLGRLREARNRLLDCIQRRPTLELLLDLSHIYASLGEIGNAQRTLHRAEELFGSDERITAALKALARAQ